MVVLSFFHNATKCCRVNHCKVRNSVQLNQNEVVIALKNLDISKLEKTYDNLVLLRCFYLLGRMFLKRFLVAFGLLAATETSTALDLTRAFKVVCKKQTLTQCFKYSMQQFIYCI